MFGVYGKRIMGNFVKVYVADECFHICVAVVRSFS